MLEESKELTSEPVLPRYRQISKRLDGGCETHRYEDPTALHRQEYFDALVTVKEEIIRQFQQQSMPLAAALKKHCFVVFTVNILFMMKYLFIQRIIY